MLGIGRARFRRQFWAALLTAFTLLFQFIAPQPANAAAISGSIDFTGNSYLQYSSTGSPWALSSSDDFTIEWWQKMESASSFPRVFSIGSYPSNAIGVSIEGGTFYFWMQSAFRASFSLSTYLNTWTHLSISRKAGKLYLHQDGVKRAEVFNSSSQSTSGSLIIGAETNGPNNGFDGKITNFRWVAGTGLYDSANYTPSRENLTAVSGTRLLLLASSSGALTTDSSGSNRTPSASSGVSFSSEFPAPPAVTASLSRVTSTPTNLSTIQYRVNFSEGITDGSLTAADFNYTVGCSPSVAKNSSTEYILSLALCPEGSISASLKALSVTSSSTGVAGPSSQTSSVTITVDRTSPTISFGSIVNPNRSNPISVAVTSNESLSGLAAADFSAPGCSTSLSGSGSGYTLSLANCTEGDITLSMTGDATDSAGNIAIRPTSVSFVADRTFASGTLTSPSTPSNQDPLSFSYTPGETLAAGAALTAGEISVSGTSCSLDTGSIVNGATFSFDVVGCADGSTAQVSIAAGALSDPAGNTNPLLSFSQVVLDKSVGVSVIGEPANTQYNSGAIDFTLNFTESVSGLNPDDLAITGGSMGCTLSNFSEQNSITSFVVSVTGCEHGASVMLTLKQNAVFDALNNFGPTTPVQTSAFVIDLVVPELLSITPRELRQNSSTVVYDVLFSEPVTGVSASMFVTNSAGCSAPALTNGATAAEYVLTLTNCADGTVELEGQPTSSISDLATNSLIPATLSAANVIVDTVAPTSSWQAAPAGPLNSLPSFTIDFSEAIDASSFDGLDITNAGTAPDCVFTISQLDADSFSVLVSGCTDGTLQPVIAAGSVLDLAGNQLDAAMTLAARTAGSVELDFTAPTVSINQTPSNPTNAATLSYQVTFGEPVQPPAPSAFAMLGGVTGCAVAIAPDGVNPDTVFDLTISGCSEGLAILTVNAFSVADLAGNLGPTLAVSASALTVDRTPASATITAQTASPTKEATLVFAISFNEPVSSLAADASHFDLVGTGCTFGTLSGAQPGTTFTLSVTGCDVATNVTLALVADSVLDAAGNSSPAAASNSAAIVTDRVAAAVSDFSVFAGNDNGLVVYNLEFDEPITGLTAADFTSSGVSVATPFTLTQLSASQYRLQVQALSSGNLTLSLPANSVLDGPGNLSPSATTSAPAEAISFDSLTGAFSQQPAVNSAGKRNSAAMSWEIAVSRAIQTSDAAKTLDASELSFAQGACSALSVSSPVASRFVISASGCSDGNIVLEVAADAIEDPDGNTWPAAPLTASTVVLDTAAPSATATAPTGAEQLTRQNFRFVFNEPISGLTLDDFSLAAGSSATGCALSYQTFADRVEVQTSGCSDGSIAVTLAANSVTDDAGNLGPSSAVTSGFVNKSTVSPTVAEVRSLEPAPEPVLLATLPAKIVGPITQQARAELLQAGVVQSPEGSSTTRVLADFTSLADPTAPAIISSSLTIPAGQTVEAVMSFDQTIAQNREIEGHLKIDQTWISLGSADLDPSGTFDIPLAFSKPGIYLIRIVLKEPTVQTLGFGIASFVSDPVMLIPGQALEVEVIVTGDPVELVVPISSAEPYLGPILTNSPQTVSSTGGEISYRGSNLDSVNEVLVSGQSMVVTASAAETITVTITALEPGTYSIQLRSDFGLTTVQDALIVTLDLQQYEGPGSFVTKRISETEVKVYAKDIIDLGKVQFLVNGREIAWVRAEDETDPKLRVVTREAGAVYYLVRTVTIEDRIRIEIRVDGLRAKFATYSN